MRSRLHLVLLFISAVVAAAQGPGAVRTIKVTLQDPRGAVILVQSGQRHVAFLEGTVAGIFEDNIRPKANLSIAIGADAVGR